ncbi:hypothetical protein ACOTHJ_13480 [Achromobacter xylosoxidans]
MNDTNKHAHTANIYARADKLLARAHELGLGKRGKPLKRDQAVELVSAEEGFRNRHVMDATLKAASVSDIPWSKLASKPEVVGMFLRKHGLLHEFALHVEQLSQQEPPAVCPQCADTGMRDTGGTYPWGEGVNAACDCNLEDNLAQVDWSNPASVVHIEAYVTRWNLLDAYLDAAGILIHRSELHGYYWELDDDASEDFNHPYEAKLNALRSLTDANAHKAIMAMLSSLNPRWQMDAAVEALERRWGHEHGYYDREDWQQDVSQGNTKLGYWEWVQHAIEANGGESDHCADCGIHRETEEGSETLCGNCGTAAERHTARIQELEPRFHRAIKSFLSPREQGHTMGAFRKAMESQSAALQIQAFTKALRTSCLSAKLQASARAVFTEMTKNQANA